MTSNIKIPSCQVDEHLHHEQQETLLRSPQQQHEQYDEEADIKDHHSNLSLLQLSKSAVRAFPMVLTSVSSLLALNHMNRSSHNTQNSVQRRLSLVLLVAGLLLVEFTFQKFYYQHQQQKQQRHHTNIDDLASIVVPKSDAFLSNLELETCKFPLFFDKSRFNWKIQDNAFVSNGHWRERNKQYVGVEDARNVYNQLQAVQSQRYHARQRAREQGQSVKDIRLTRRNITFVHIGKAGGSSVACNLRAGRRYIQNHCDNIDYDAMDAEANYDPAKHNGQPYIPESAISRHVNCYTHWRMHLKCFYLQGDHPFANIDMANADHNFGSRALSSTTTTESDGASIHHHHSSSTSDHHHHSSSRVEKVEPYKGTDYTSVSEQEKVPQHHTTEPYPGNDFLVNMRSPVDRIASWFVYEHAENHEYVYNDRPYHCGQLVLSSCYQHFEHLTTVGLSFPRPSINQPLKVGTNLTAVECSHWAWATIQGNMPADYHNSYNYDWYAHRLLHDPINKNADVFVLRVEHLEQDWTTVDTMLGGDGSFPSTMATKQNSASIKPLRITNHNTTDVGIENLCRALCDEIQVYKQLLVRAINLEAADIDASMEELRQQCPEETDILPRECHYP